MANENKNKEKQENVDVAGAVGKVELFLDSNKKLIWGIIAAVVVVAAVSYACFKWVYMPAKQEAQAQMYKAESAFRSSEWDIALNGDGNALGFAQIISDYGSKAGKSVYMYAAACALQLGDADGALSYIAKYNGKDEILAGRALCIKGDALCIKGEYAAAAAAFKAAAAKSDNVFSAGYLLKAGQALEADGNPAEALKCYETVKDQYPQSMGHTTSTNTSHA